MSLSVPLVHTPSSIPGPLIFTYGTASEPLSPSYELSSENVTPKGNITPRNNPLNLVPTILAGPIQIQIRQILLFQSHLTHLKTIIIK